MASILNLVDFIIVIRKLWMVYKLYILNVRISMSKIFLTSFKNIY
jgi:hypothetical protein